MKRIKKIMGAVLAVVMLCMAAMLLQVSSADSIRNILMEQVEGGWLCKIPDPKENIGYKVYQIFTGDVEIGADGNLVFGTQVFYGDSFAESGEKVPQEVLDAYASYNTGYISSVFSDLTEYEELTYENPSVVVPDGFYITMAFDPGSGDINVDVNVYDWEESIPQVSNPSVSGEMVDGKYSLTVEKGVNGHRYEVYQIFTGSVNKDGKTLGNVKYGSNYGEQGEAVPGDLLEQIRDAKEFAKEMVSDERFHGDPVVTSTGGIGTFIFYITGGLLVLAAGTAVVAKKRAEDEEENM